MRIGLEQLKLKPSISQSWGRCALVCNQASVTKDFDDSWRIVSQILGKRLVALFGPQHGMISTVQENMLETEHAVHPSTGLPLYSLYSEVREPTTGMLEGIDTILFDLPITGCRIYTYKYTLSACLRAAKKHDKRVVVLDRPNPLGGEILEGRVLDKDCTSFVGEFPIPMRHGLTMAEAALFFNQSIGAQLEIVQLEGWNPSWLWDDLDRPWVLTSPNLPCTDSAYTFPGTVSFEGTNVSEGRGTCLPFLFIGAPYIKDADRFKRRVEELAKSYTAGVFLRPTAFQPAFHKWSGQICQGVQIHVTDPRALRSYKLGLAMIQACQDEGEKDFQWRQPPYEYNYHQQPICILLGNAKVESFFGSAFSIDDPRWTQGISTYREQARDVLLYPRKSFGLGVE